MMPSVQNVIINNHTKGVSFVWTVPPWAAHPLFGRGETMKRLGVGEVNEALLVEKQTAWLHHLPSFFTVHLRETILFFTRKHGAFHARHGGGSNE